MKRFRQATDTLREIIVYYLLTMLTFAALFYWVEDIGFLDAVYWSGVTMTTVGYGDISPHTILGKILSVTLANFSIFFLAPLIVVRMIEHLVDNKDIFSHDEQEDLKTRLTRIEKLLESGNDTHE